MDPGWPYDHQAKFHWHILYFSTTFKNCHPPSPPHIYLRLLPICNIFFFFLFVLRAHKISFSFPCAVLLCRAFTWCLFLKPVTLCSSSLALLQRLPGSFQFSRNFDLPSRFGYALQTKEEVRAAALLNVQTSCNKVCINNASWNTDFFIFFFKLWESRLFFKTVHSFYSSVCFCMTLSARDNCQEAPLKSR